MTRRLAPLLVLGAIASCLAYTSAASAGVTKRVVALTAAVIVLSVSLASGAPKRLGVNPAWGCAIGFIGWSALSAAWGADGAVLDLGVPLAALALGSVSASLGVEHARRVATLVALAIGSVLSVVVLGAWLLGSRGFGLHAGQGNPNWTGLTLAVTLPLAVSDPLRRSWADGARKAARVCIGSATLAALIATESRTGVVAAAAGLAVVFLGRVRSRSWRAGAVASLIVTLACAMAVCTNATGGAEATRGAEHALRGRWWIHDLSLRAALEHLPWGAGLGRFREAFLAEQGRALAGLSPVDAAQRFQNATTAHQDFLEVALESGAPALLLFILALVLAFRQHFQLGFVDGAGSLAAFLTAALADSPWRETALPIVLALVFAALPRPADQEAPGRALLALRVALLASAGILLPRAVGTFAASRAWSAARDAAPPRRLELLRKAAQLDPTNAALALELGAARLELAERDAAIQNLLRAERLEPDVAGAVALGNALLARGASNDAAAAYQRALALNSGSFRARVGAAESLRRSGRFADAEKHAVVAVALLPGDARARELLDRIREQSMDATLGLPPAANE